ncbi:hypothetical protein [Aliiglaciecola sp. NS0011-25]|uniref:hypothetical protein n=1 Tax=Aliiglaciecola sp. NS0011-25 TaxID=3127654 RepID=UPI00310413DB
MNSHSVVSVNPRYKSSTRIDSQGGFQEFIDEFVLHGTAINTIETFCRSFSNSAQRTFTLTGPYGSGKSTIALFITFLLSQNSEERNYAQEKIANVEGLTDLVKNAFRLTKGWQPIKHVCGLSSPAQSILLSIATQTKHKLNEQEVSELSDAQCLEQIKTIFNRKVNKCDGYILLLDELGKALDFQSRSGADLYFFQELADIAQQASTDVIVIGFLHQAFAEYAKNKDALTQKEWAKVQGRYVDFGFNPSIDESLVLVGDSIQKSKQASSTLQKKFSKLADITTKSFKGQSKNRNVLINTFPLDPLVSLLLGPISRRRFSQNERSLFGFLASNEKFGFRAFLHQYYDVGLDNLCLYSPESLWDYLEHNLHHIIVTSSDGKAWLEACDAIQRAAQKGSDLHVSITKIIALLTIFGFQNHIHASREFLVEYLTERGEDRGEVETVITELEKWTVIIFRQKHNALFVFQGSDIDINSLVVETIESISEGVDWTSVCNVQSPVLATSHYHKTGSMRWTNTLIVDKLESIDSSILEKEQLSGQAFATFVVIAKKCSEKKLESFSLGSPAIILASPEGIEPLKAIAIELLALEHIKKHERQISHDLIAKNELESRIEDAKRNLDEQFHEILEQCHWMFEGKKLSYLPLSAIASQVADSIFSDAPVVLNELVNRSKPSGSANAAINKLMLCMLENASKEDLGFEPDSFPPEKGIYLSCLKSKGWHKKTAEGFIFPYEWDEKAKSTHSKMYNLWQSGVDLIKGSSGMVTMDQLYRHWMAPPFGLTSGLCRIYGLALLKSLEGQVAFYDNDSTKNSIFIPELDEVFVNKLHKHPQEAGVRYFEISGIQSDLINKIAEATHSSTEKDSSILEIAKHIVKLIHLLPTWVKKTSGDSFIDGSKLGLTGEARAFRNEVLRANDPYKLILESLPSIFSIDTTTENSKETLAKKLKSAIEDLSSQHEMLTNGFKQIVIDLLGCKFDNDLKHRCENVSNASQRPSVKEFATRLAKFIDGKLGFEMVIATAAGAHERNWTDRHIRNALDEIQNLCVQFRRIESFSRFSDVGFSKPVALITKGDSGKHEEYEIHLSKSLDDDKEVVGIVDKLNSLLKDMPIDKKRAALSQLLINNMEKVMSGENAS